MDVADCLIDKIFFLVNLLAECANSLTKLASDLEQHNKNINVSKVVGSSVTVGGAVAVTAAGAITLVTGGLSIPALGVAGAIATGLGLATTVGLNVVRNVLSSSAMSDAKQISDKIEKGRNEILTLMNSLTGEQQRKNTEECCFDSDIPPNVYIVEQILKAMAKRKGLELSDKINLTTLMSDLSLKTIPGMSTDSDFMKLSPLKIPTMKQFVEDVVNIAKLEKEQNKGLVGQDATLIGHVSTGVVGLLFAVTELINNIQNLKKCETEASENLREIAETLQKASENMKRELDEIEELCQTLADKKNSSSARCSIL